jgi:hypothetical protein
MPIEPSTPRVIVSLEALPPHFDDLPYPVRQEVLARIAYACDWYTIPATEDLWPNNINTWVTLYRERHPADGTELEFHELRNLWIPANGHGFHSDDQWNGAWLMVQTSWDEESTSTINRDHYGNLQHWM